MSLILVTYGLAAKDGDNTQLNYIYNLASQNQIQKKILRSRQG